MNHFTGLWEIHGLKLAEAWGEKFNNSEGVVLKMYEKMSAERFEHFTDCVKEVVKQARLSGLTFFCLCLFNIGCWVTYVTAVAAAITATVP